MRLLTLLLFCTACDPVEEDLSGMLVRVEVTGAPDCYPERFLGDAGIQFFAERADGGFLFTMSQQAHFGPSRDGFGVATVERQVVPAPNAGHVIVGQEAGCDASLSDWVRTAAGFSLAQRLPGADFCTSGPGWLPRSFCSPTRFFTFTEVGACQLSCVRISPSSGEIECRC